MKIRQKEFTLIELLVVIAILGILAGLLMPAVQKARSTAIGTTCLSNYRQISNALELYKSEYSNFLPRNASAQSYPRDPRTSGKLNVVEHVHGILDYHYLHSFQILNRDGNTCTINKNAGGEIWMCPVIYPLTETRKIANSRPLGMFLNGSGAFKGKKTNTTFDHDFFGHVSGQNQRLENGKNIKLSAPLSNIPLIFEICDGARTRDSKEISGYTAANGVPCPHNGGMSVIWADGHVAIEKIPSGKKLNPCPEGENDKFSD